MVLIKRTVEGHEISREFRQRAQAAINSDGHITIRGYNDDSANKDETMLVLSRDETRAIFELMEQIARFSKNSLPF